MLTSTSIFNAGPNDGCEQNVCDVVTKILTLALTFLHCENHSKRPGNFDAWINSLKISVKTNQDSAHIPLQLCCSTNSAQRSHVELIKALLPSDSGHFLKNQQPKFCVFLLQAADEWEIIGNYTAKAKSPREWGELLMFSHRVTLRLVEQVLTPGHTEVSRTCSLTQSHSSQ